MSIIDAVILAADGYMLSSKDFLCLLAKSSELIASGFIDTYGMSNELAIVFAISNTFDLPIVTTAILSDSNSLHTMFLSIYSFKIFIVFKVYLEYIYAFWITYGCLEF